jgi:hypothetical protein
MTKGGFRRLLLLSNSILPSWPLPSWPLSLRHILGNFIALGMKILGGSESVWGLDRILGRLRNWDFEEEFDQRAMVITS